MPVVESPTRLAAGSQPAVAPEPESAGVAAVVPDRPVVGTGRLTRLFAALDREFARDGVVTWWSAETGAYHLPGALDFPLARDRLPTNRRNVLKIMAGVLARVLPCHVEGGPGCAMAPDDGPPLVAVIIEGHSMDRPAGSARFQANWQLTTSRAHWTWLTLTRHQPGLAKLRSPGGRPLFRLGGHAASVPRDRDQRRVELRFVLQGAEPTGAASPLP